LGESDKPLKLERNYNQQLCNILLPGLNLKREAARSYICVVSEAASMQKTKAEAMRLFKLAFKVLSNIDDDSFLIGDCKCCLRQHNADTLEHMLSASILTDSDLAEIDSYSVARKTA
jgi:hypothetical protein